MILTDIYHPDPFLKVPKMLITSNRHIVQIITSNEHIITWTLFIIITCIILTPEHTTNFIWEVATTKVNKPLKVTMRPLGRNRIYDYRKFSVN